MLTIVAVPRPFRDEFDRIQRNAIESWMHLRPAADIVLIGDDEGVPEICRELSLRHIPTVDKSPTGRPIVSDIVRRASAAARSDPVVYINADVIIVTEDLDARLAEVRTELGPFVAMSSPWRLWLEERISFDAPRWRSDLIDRVRSEAVTPGGGGTDLCAFPPGLYDGMPPFVLGHPGWDHWLIYYARKMKLPFVDLTPAIVTVHQNHAGSTHVRELPSGTESEGLSNSKLAGPRALAFRVFDASHELTPGGLRRKNPARQLVRAAMRRAPTGLKRATLPLRRRLGLLKRRLSIDETTTNLPGARRDTPR